MPDDEPLTAPVIESAEDMEERAPKFFQHLGITDTEFPSTVEAAINHALAARPAPPAHNWFPIGPRNVGGRVRELFQDPTNASTIYAGTALGGVWRTRNAGDTWEPLAEIGHDPGDQSFAVGALAVPAQTPTVVYVGTGDQVDFYGAGRGLWKYVINDATPSVTFKRIVDPDPVGTKPSDATATAGAPRYTRLRMDPDVATRFWAASPNGVFQIDVKTPEPATAPFVTAKRVFPPSGTDPAIPGGAPALPGAVGAPFVTDLLVAPDPRDKEKVGDKARFLMFHVAVSGKGIYRGRFDRNSGVITWDAELGPAHPNAFRRIRLAQCQTRPEFVYAVYEEATGKGNNFHKHPSVIYRSSNSGGSWTPGANRMPLSAGYSATDEGIAWYALPLSVHPERPEIVVCGSVDLFLSTDSGDNWTVIIDWTNYDAGDRSQHGDQHCVVFDNIDPHKIWVANDGGVCLASDIRRPAQSPGYWRKRSHGILAGQFLDITADRALPFLYGGGLQDNGTYVGFGGPTWYHFGGGDGGMTAFDPTNPRVVYTSWQGAIESASVVAPTFPSPVGNYQSPVVNDVPAPSGTMAVQSASVTTVANGIPGANGATWVGIIEHHPTAAGTLMIGRVAAGFSSTTSGASWSPLVTAPGSPLPLAAAEEVNALAFGVKTAAGVEGWLGTDAGKVFVTNNAPTGNWTAVVVPWGGAAPNPKISRIATHPTNSRVVAISTAEAGGRVLLSYDRGANWKDISAPIAGATNNLPPCPITSIAFDPASPTDLYAGTLAGVYALRGLPAPPAGGGLVPAIANGWAPFNNGLPLTLVNDIAFLPASGGRRVLRAASFGRGMFDCAVGGPVQRQLYIRQTLIEDGRSYPRPTPLPVTTDLRLPATGAGSLTLDYNHSFDIRLDAPPYSFFEDVMDGVEFDETLANDVAVPGETNIVYVQVLNSGYDSVRDVTVHLYFRTAPVVNPGDPVPALGNTSDFWHSPSFDIPAGAGATWERAGIAQTIPAVRPGQPAVVRFEWVPPIALASNRPPATGRAALLALCTGTSDALPAAAPAANIPALIAQERRAALRIIEVGPWVPDVYLRHAADDDGSAGAVPFGGRSPDIIVTQSEPGDLRNAFRDLSSPRAADRLKSGTNFIYVRVFNRRNIDVEVDVEVFWTKPHVARAAAEGNVPPFDQAKWGAVTPTGSAQKQPLRARDWTVVKLQWDNPPDPEADPAHADPYRAILLIAFVKTSDDLDPEPVRARVSNLRSFWTTFRSAADTNNATMRAIRFEK